MNKVRNLTAHPLNFFRIGDVNEVDRGGGRKSYELKDTSTQPFAVVESEGAYNVTKTEIPLRNLQHIPDYNIQIKASGDPLPEQEEGVLIVVSAMVAGVVKRDDIRTIVNPVYDMSGDRPQIMGALGIGRLEEDEGLMQKETGTAA